MKKIISLIIAIAIFIGWMFLVGSPSETETIIGLIIAGGVGLWLCNSLGCLDI
ncbi:hypothetical protein [Sulfurovum sp.]|uniref:hypothetical protein n=1 Tax=Sulfurovum sp. TaxID=1969726 RepID=UPI002A35E315|nr:hypothetical protein [Sulfurovum sp.]MDD3499788.1 hypothetical protein [Sulfurovum sp.]MDY0403557.1 hypothetical protein [Sulfurovum sp.]